MLGLQVSAGFGDLATALLLPRGKETCRLRYEIFSAWLQNRMPGALLKYLQLISSALSNTEARTRHLRNVCNEKSIYKTRF